MSVKWKPGIDVRKGIVVNPEGALVYELPRDNSKVLDTKTYGSQIEYVATDHRSFLIDKDRDFYIVGDDNYLGYVKRDDLRDLNSEDCFCYLTYPEMSYLNHLLEYANEEFYVYSANYLGRFGIKLEEVADFINELKTKIQKGDNNHE